MSTQAVARRLPLLCALAAAAALGACSSGGSDAPTPQPRTLASIQVTPASPLMLAGSAVSLYATAFYSDQTSSDVTAQATWASSNGAVVSVSNDAGARGDAQALAAGTAAVTAAFGGLTGTANARVLEPGAGVTLAGTVTYDFVPATYDPATDGGTLAFGAASQKPVRNAVVRVMQGTTQLGEAVTDEEGRYVVTFLGTETVSVLALARTVSPPIQVQDNTDLDAVWAIGRAGLPAANATVNLHATHGWTGASYDPSARSAAPFAILDSMYTAARGFLAVRDPVFPALRVNWSPDNSTGVIGTSHYSPAEREIYILGMAGQDTDEFDAHVIVHEWAHYFEDNLSRADSPGGPHGTGDALDPRLAFGEGYGSALAAMLLPEPVYADTYWWGGGIDAFGWDAENVPSPTDDCFGPPLECVPGLNPGPFSEMSIIRALYDLRDDSGTSEAWDGTSIGLGTIYDVLVGPQRTTDAFTTIGSFVAGLKAQAGVSGPAVDAVLAKYSIGAITDAWGTGDTDLRAMYRTVSVFPSSGLSFQFDGRFDANMQQRNRYLHFTAPSSSVTVSSTSSQDVDLYAYRQGALVAAGERPGSTESITFATQPGLVYVVHLFGYDMVNGTYTATVSISAN